MFWHISRVVKRSEKRSMDWFKRGSVIRTSLCNGTVHGPLVPGTILNLIFLELEHVHVPSRQTGNFGMVQFQQRLMVWSKIKYCNLWQLFKHDIWDCKYLFFFFFIHKNQSIPSGKFSDLGK